MADAARVGVMSPRPATVRLRLSVRETPAFDIHDGATYIDISSLDGSEPAGVDPRRLSVAVFQLKLGGVGVP